MTISMQAYRIEVLRAFQARGWTGIPIEHRSQRGVRALNWLTEKGWLEQHPTRFLTDYQITDDGYEVLAQMGGDVTGWG